jgi:hypothetical protein
MSSRLDGYRKFKGNIILTIVQIMYFSSKNHSIKGAHEPQAG